ncbi:MAG: hypothetical protein ACKO38_08190, partial [Planctomycetota bacterium]
MLPFFQTLAKASTREALEIRGVHNTLGKLGRFVAAPSNEVNKTSASWRECCEQLLQKIRTGYFDKESYCDIDWNDIERHGVSPDTAASSGAVKSPTPHQLRYRSQFAGLMETLLAVVAWGTQVRDEALAQVRDEALARAADDFLTASAARDWLKPGWPSPRAQHGLKDFTAFDLERYRVLGQVFPEDWHAGHWAVYDLLGRWQWFSQQARRERRTVSAPICLWLDTGRACLIPYLCVELTLGETGGFLPCMDRMGMTLATRFTKHANGQDLGVEPYPHDFLAAMQRAWFASGMSDLKADSPLKVRGRWWIATREPFGGQIPLLCGRSAEAATCCALWSALGGRPSDTQPLSGSALRMDDERPITGTIVVQTSLLGHRELRLGKVGHVLEKALALPVHKLSGPFIVPKDNEWEFTDQDKELITPLSSVVDAYEQALAVGRVRASYVAAVDAEFRGEWLPETLPPRMLSERDGGGIDSPSEPPAAPEDVSVPADKYRSPYIRTQTIKLLSKTANPRIYLRAEHFQSRRKRDDSSSTKSDPAKDQWQAIGRDALLSGLTMVNGAPGPFHHLVITSDAGMGKTTLLDWIWWEFNSPTGDQLAIRVTAKDLGDAFGQIDRNGGGKKSHETTTAITVRPSDANKAIVRLLVNELLAKDGSRLKMSAKQARHYLVRLRSSGRLTLLVDGLDELRADNKLGFEAIRFIAADKTWKTCRLIIAGRPYALEESWNRIFRRGDSTGWSFLLVDEFNEEEQERYLGSILYDRVKDVASDLLGCARSIYYLRRFVSNPDNIRVASDVYLTAVVKLVADGV